MPQKRLVILGSTGSIGEQTLEIVQAHPQRLQVVGLAARRNWPRVRQQAEDFSVSTVALADERAVAELAEAGPDMRVLAGQEGLTELVKVTQPDLVVGAISGLAGLEPVLTALQTGCCGVPTIGHRR